MKPSRVSCVPFVRAGVLCASRESHRDRERTSQTDPFFRCVSFARAGAACNCIQNPNHKELLRQPPAIIRKPNKARNLFIPNEKEVSAGRWHQQQGLDTNRSSLAESLAAVRSSILFLASLKAWSHSGCSCWFS